MGQIPLNQYELTGEQALDISVNAGGRRVAVPVSGRVVALHCQLSKFDMDAATELALSVFAAATPDGGSDTLQHLHTIPASFLKDNGFTIYPAGLNVSQGDGIRLFSDGAQVQAGTLLSYTWVLTQ